jgi:hypothetical protein
VVVNLTTVYNSVCCIYLKDAVNVNGNIVF